MNTDPPHTTGQDTASSRQWPSSSPRISDHTLARYPSAVTPPGPHTGAELASLRRMLRQAGAATIAVGHGHAPASVAAARALAAAWTAAGGTVLGVVDWPAAAASWLRPARRLTAGHPDAWVIADTVAGCAQVVRRLAEQPNWAATRTVGFAGLASPDLVALTTPTSLAGMTGATATGGTWRVGPDHLIVTDKPDRPR
jgi:hypothetical protein